MAPTSILFYKDVGHSQEGAQEVIKLFGDKGVFDGPKPVRLLQRLITLANLQDDSIVLDFFSGSATTGHALMKSNMESGKQCKFILVQIPEVISEKKKDSGYATICEIGKERIRRAGKKIREEMEAKQAAKRAKKGLFAGEDAPALDTGFRVLKLASTNMEDVYYQPRDVQQGDLFKQLMNVKGDRTPLDLLFQVMLELGITLDADIREEEIAGRQVYRVNDTQLVACFEEDCPEAVVEAISKLKPLYAVVREPKDDATMTNFDEFFKTNSPDTHRRTL